MSDRQTGSRRAAAVVIAAVLLLGSACDGRAAKTEAPTAVNTVAPPGAPPAAGITGTPQAGGAGVPAGQTAEATIGRIRLFPTDLPAGWSAGAVVVNAPWAEMAADPRQARLQAALTAGGETVSTVVWLFKTPATARAHLDDVTARGPAALRELLQNGAARYLAGIADVSTPVEAGEGARLFRLAAADGQPAGALVISLRGAALSTVIVRGAPDAAALARVLDGRAAAAQR